MRVAAMELHCQCGGVAKSLPEDDEGHYIFYMVTDRNSIIFQGLCDRCGVGFKVEKPIISLFFVANPDTLAH